LARDSAVAGRGNKRGETNEGKVPVGRAQKSAEENTPPVRKTTGQGRDMEGINNRR